MRSLTLSSSVLRAHSPPWCPPPPKLFTPCFFSLNSGSKKQSSRPRYSEQWLAKTSENRSGSCLQSIRLDFRHFDLENCQPASESFENLDDCCASVERFVKNDLRTEESFENLDDCCASVEWFVKNDSRTECSVAFDASSFDGSLKLMLLSGLLTLQGSQPELAGPDLASGLQSIPYLGDLGDINTGFASAFLLIFFSELGDKTFFIAALLAARNSAAVVFIGTFGALAAMTIISVALGRSFHYVDEILPFRFGETDLPIDDIAAVCLLVYFGVSTLLDASSSDAKAEDEQKEAELAVSEFSGNGAGILAAASTIVSTFLLVFVAEWGDKSFFSTIALAAASSPLGVIGGALAGHGVATLLAVLGGSILGTFLSEKVIAYTGGVLFLVFAVVTLVEIVT